MIVRFFESPVSVKQFPFFDDFKIQLLQVEVEEAEREEYQIDEGKIHSQLILVDVELPVNNSVEFSIEDKKVAKEEGDYPKEETEVVHYGRVVILWCQPVVILFHVPPVAVEQEGKQHGMIDQTEESGLEDSVEYQYPIINEVHHMSKSKNERVVLVEALGPDCPAAIKTLDFG